MAADQSTVEYRDLPELPSDYGAGEIRHVPGWPGYAVTDLGAVWSCRGYGRFGTWHQLKAHPTCDGYPMVNVVMIGRRRAYGVHVLILMAFRGPAPAGMEACHDDGVPANCYLKNLRWDTHLANMRDKARHGTDPSGERNPRAKLTAEDVKKLRAEYVYGSRTHGGNALARRYGISQKVLLEIIAGKVWKCIPSEPPQKVRTACLRGHPYTPENRRQFKGRKATFCVICARESKRQWHQLHGRRRAAGPRP